MRLPGSAGLLRFFACMALLVFVAVGGFRLRTALGVEAAGRGQQAKTGARLEKRPVVVELFTSEGCSSCPPADALLARLDQEQPVNDAEIIVLGEHVDYWDGLGWKDRFSSAESTERQREYGEYFKLGDIYTPQAVVSGMTQWNGADEAGIVRAIQHADAANTVPLELTGVQVHGGEVTFSLKDGMPEKPEYVSVYAALVDPADKTEVKGGENRGRTLRHVGVVRTLARVGSTSRTKALGERPFGLQSRVPGSLDGLRLVVFVQAKPIGPVLGAVECVLGPVGGRPGSPSAGRPCPVAGASAVVPGKGDADQRMSLR